MNGIPSWPMAEGNPEQSSHYPEHGSDWLARYSYIKQYIYQEKENGACEQNRNFKHTENLYLSNFGSVLCNFRKRADDWAFAAVGYRIGTETYPTGGP